MPGQERTEPARKRTEPDVLVWSSEEAARALRVDRNQFDSWWDPTRKGWDIPVGDGTVFVRSIGHTARKRRVPIAALQAAINGAVA